MDKQTGSIIIAKVTENTLIKALDSNISLFEKASMMTFNGFIDHFSFCT
jgi:hypothetical protein